MKRMTMAMEEEDKVVLSSTDKHREDRVDREEVGLREDNSNLEVDMIKILVDKDQVKEDKAKVQKPNTATFTTKTVQLTRDISVRLM